ncbi:SMC-Scp complex subunit ScpB [Mariprofundus sp. EBB-1]|uniref:SMC-Scp complex subunit ScpB n=1 Tax=Mariprofundus sp. EBB-1 TaxID=2650971 RepID=UPI000EF233C5|nr:SMC-Scp complex subunit ScpB [Mariprofundus sp. EBB-1]RLL51253.1 SMC-Scp complex subunit ScpB [Mariprofundus sp. EBB-1]
MNLLTARIEALLLASDEPLSVQKIHVLLLSSTSTEPHSEDSLSADIQHALIKLESDYQTHGIHIAQVAGGWQLRTAPEHAELVQRLWQVKAPRLSRSALETLAIIAYRQPTTRAEIEALRGVRVSSQMLSNLQERGWIKVIGRKDVPGRPHLFGTGKQFLIDFGLNGLKDLPDSNQLMDHDELNPALSQRTLQQSASEQESANEQNSEHQHGTQ